MSIETSKKKKGIQMPHTYIILFLIVLVVCLLTYVIPAGQFERQEDASGRMLIVPVHTLRWNRHRFHRWKSPWLL